VGNWGFIGLAYGFAAIALTAYVVGLRGRLREAGQTLTALERDGGRSVR
jgi:hypothetical protein